MPPTPRGSPILRPDRGPPHWSESFESDPLHREFGPLTDPRATISSAGSIVGMMRMLLRRLTDSSANVDPGSQGPWFEWIPGSKPEISLRVAVNVNRLGARLAP